MLLEMRRLRCYRSAVPLFWGSLKSQMESIRTPGKVVIVSQHYAPDQSTTAGIITAIATHLAKVMKVLVLSGTSGSSPRQLLGRPRFPAWSDAAAQAGLSASCPEAAGRPA